LTKKIFYFFFLLPEDADWALPLFFSFFLSFFFFRFSLLPQDGGVFISRGASATICVQALVVCVVSAGLRWMRSNCTFTLINRTTGWIVPSRSQSAAAASPEQVCCRWDHGAGAFDLSEQSAGSADCVGELQSDPPLDVLDCPAFDLAATKRLVPVQRIVQAVSVIHHCRRDPPYRCQVLQGKLLHNPHNARYLLNIYKFDVSFPLA
jgi:hypothetical protein